MSAQVAGKRPLGAVGRAGIVVGMHVAVLFVIAQAFVMKEKTKLPPDINATFIDEPTIIDAPPPIGPVEPDMLHDDLWVPEPVAPPMDMGDESPPISGTNDVVPPPVIQPRVNLVSVRADPRYPLTQPQYPVPDVREGNEGSTEIEVYVLPSGRVGDARVLRSSGFPRLDQAALDEAKRKWRLQPASRDGVAIGQWHPLRVVFKLKNNQ
jgi:protein TonB